MTKPVFVACNRCLSLKSVAPVGFLITMLLLAAGNRSIALGQSIDDLRGEDTTQVEKRRFTYPFSIVLKPAEVNCKIEITTPTGKRLEPKSTSLRLAAGSYLLSAECEGYKKWSKQFAVPRDVSGSGGRPGSLAIALERLRATITVFTNPPETDVFLNGLPQLRSGADGFLVLPPLDFGEHELRFQKEGYLPKPKVVQLRVPRDEKILRVDLTLDQPNLEYQSLKKALAEKRIAQAIGLYENLRITNYDQAKLTALLKQLPEHLNLRSAELLKQGGPSGLTMQSRDIGDMLRFYEVVRSWSVAEGFEPNKDFRLFQSFWEAKSLSLQIQRSSEGVSTDQLTKTLKMQLTSLETLASGSATLLYELGWIYFALNDLQRAHSAFQAAQAADPNWAYPHFGLGATQLQQAYTARQSKTNYRSNLLNAAKEFEWAIRQDQRFIEAYVMLAFSYADGGRAEQAIAVSLAALMLAPENGKVKLAVGYSYFAAGRKHFVSARPFLEAALSASKDPLDNRQKERANVLLMQITKRRN